MNYWDIKIIYIYINIINMYWDIKPKQPNCAGPEGKIYAVAQYA